MILTQLRVSLWTHREVAWQLSAQRCQPKQVCVYNAGGAAVTACVSGWTRLNKCKGSASPMQCTLDGFQPD